jgi:hypothetical protein
MAEQADELAGLRELAERLLLMRGPFAVADTPPPQLIAGRLPDGLPLQLPLPTGTRVVGGVRRQQPLPGMTASGEATEIVLDVPGSVDDVLQFYDRELPALGWAARDSDAPRPGGFTPFPIPRGRNFSRNPDGPVLSVRADEPAGGVLDVRISLSPAGARPFAAGPSWPPGVGVLPSLAPPPGVPLQPLGGGGGPATMSSTAVARTDESAQALAAHFAQQFQAAGWTRTDGSAGGPVAWSTWSSPAHENWTGLLLVVEEPTPGQRLLHARVNLAGTDWLRAPGVWVGTAGSFARF